MKMLHRGLRKKQDADRVGEGNSPPVGIHIHTSLILGLMALFKSLCF